MQNHQPLANVTVFSQWNFANIHTNPVLNGKSLTIVMHLQETNNTAVVEARREGEQTSMRREGGRTARTRDIFSAILCTTFITAPLLWILHEEQRMHAGLAFAIFNAAQTTTKCPLRYGHGCNTHEYAMRWHRVRSIIPLVFWIQGCSSRRSTLL